VTWCDHRAHTEAVVRTPPGGDGPTRDENEGAMIRVTGATGSVGAEVAQLLARRGPSV
jgi:hypothetical protein